MANYDNLNDQQKQAVETTRGPLLILAGAGSGKTKTLTHRIAHLIHDEGVDPFNILAITFTNKAAEEMRTRVRDMVGPEADRIWVTTFHSTCIRILRRHIDRLGYDLNFTVYDTDDQKTVMKNVCKRLNIDTKNYKERTILNAISSAKDSLVSVSEYSLSTFGDFTKIVIARAYKEYQEQLKKSNALDFDDIIVLTVQLFKENPEILDFYQERFKYISVDEYQDTNKAQFELVRLLADKYRNLCVVGDDDQSIYKFRGANIRNILDFEEFYPEATVIKLEQNYRSTQNILDAANAVIANNRSRKVKSLWTSEGAGHKIRFMQLDNAYEEAETIVDEISSSVRRDDASYNDIAVLYRTNAQARLIEERLVLRGIPYNVVGGTNFYARAEIKDMIAYLKTIENGLDEVALRRIINVPKRSIGTVTIDKLLDFAEITDDSLFGAMQNADNISGLGKAGAKILNFVSLIENLRKELKAIGIAGVLNAIIEATDYYEYLKDQDEDSADDRISNVDELINKATVYEENAEEPSLTGFLEEVALVSDIDNIDNTDGRVLLMTLHSAKGLEFPRVYIAGMEDGLFPGMATISSGDSSDMEEERRLAYVGITRAKEYLTITCAKMRMLHGETQFNPVSRFVKEIPGELIDGMVPGSKISRSDYDEIDYGRGSRNFGGGYSDSRRSYGYDEGYANGGKPSARLKSYATPDARKPAMQSEIKNLNAIAGLSKGMPAGNVGELSFTTGDTVKHRKFGTGVVTGISKEPRDYKVTVDFDDYGTKIMYASFAKLEKV
ncbi:MAG: UvrD-helicase domain-containing protein [Lachnospiraceae bacterium]|nr:UvrD-helicase domain-containing protein [Lachnospiraceae bacterium]